MQYLELLALEAPQRNKNEEYCPDDRCHDRYGPDGGYRLSRHQSPREFRKGPGEDQRYPLGQNVRHNQPTKQEAQTDARYGSARVVKRPQHERQRQVKEQV